MNFLKRVSRLFLVFRRRSIVYSGPHFFELASSPFSFQAFSPGGGGRFCSVTDLSPLRRLAQKGNQAIESFFPISLLAPLGMGFNDQQPFFGNPVAGQLKQALSDLVGQRGRMDDIESELNGRGNLIHVLSAGSRGSNKFKLNLLKGNRKLGCNFQ